MEKQIARGIQRQKSADQVAGCAGCLTCLVAFVVLAIALSAAHLDGAVDWVAVVVIFGAGAVVYGVVRNWMIG